MTHWELFRKIKVYVQLQDHVDGQKVPVHKRPVKAKAAKPNKYGKWGTGTILWHDLRQ